MVIEETVAALRTLWPNGAGRLPRNYKRNRNPFDMIVSAYLYHLRIGRSQAKCGATLCENWLYQPTTFCKNLEPRDLRRHDRHGDLLRLIYNCLFTTAGRRSTRDQGLTQHEGLTIGKPRIHYYYYYRVFSTTVLLQLMEWKESGRLQLTQFIV